MFLSIPFRMLPDEMIRCISSYLAVEDIESVLCSCRMPDEHKLEWIPSVLQAYRGEDEDRPFFQTYPGEHEVEDHLFKFFVRILRSRRLPFDRRKTLTIFVRAGVDINRTGEPLFFAATCGYNHMVEMLIDFGADINMAYHGRAPLITATYYGHKDIVRVLIDAGAVVNVADGYGYTPLHFAAGRTNSDIFEMLMDAGADINRATNNGTTPLSTAKRCNRVIVRMLMDAGADVRSIW